jgi:hypothetical protein
VGCSIWSNLSSSGCFTGNSIICSISSISLSSPPSSCRLQSCPMGPPTRHSPPLLCTWVAGTTLFSSGTRREMALMLTRRASA